jgi:hypothetical protein
MKIITHVDEVPVRIPGNFDWDEFNRGLGLICGQMEHLLQNRRCISTRTRTGWVCKINSSRISDIQAWPPDRKSWAQEQRAQNGDTLDVIDFPNVQLTLAIDDQVPSDRARWSFHWHGTLK